tara:strand:- start:453 stop:1415 length:963 start_codon:yes stop_codon:yes gene_type:complete
MKKFFTLLSLLVVMGMSANVMAQNAGDALSPAIGDVFNYAVNNNGNSYNWYVSLSEEIDGAPVAGTVASLENGGTNQVSITWLAPAVGTVYYVHVTETASEDNGGCMNHKVIAVVPRNAFTLQFVNVSEAGVEQPVDATYLVCPPAIANDITYAGNATANTPATTFAEATEFTYDYGTTYLYYKITAAGIATSTTDYTVTITPTIQALIENDRSATVSADFGTMSSGTFTTAGTTQTVKDDTEFSHTVSAGENAEDLWLRIAVANGTEYEGTTEADIVLSLTGKDEFLNTVTSVNGSGTATDTESTKVKARPNTGNITTP